MVESAPGRVASQPCRCPPPAGAGARSGAHSVPGAYAAGGQRLHAAFPGDPVSDPRRCSFRIARRGRAFGAASGWVCGGGVPGPLSGGRGMSAPPAAGVPASSAPTSRHAELSKLHVETVARSDERYPHLAGGQSARVMHKVRRAQARRPSRLYLPKTAARKLHLGRSLGKHQNPQIGPYRARFDWGLGAVCRGASPVAAVFGSAPGCATPPEHRIYLNPASATPPSKPDISTGHSLGHFYLALTAPSRERVGSTRNVRSKWHVICPLSRKGEAGG